MPEEEGMQGGNIFTNRIMGIPGVVWLIGAGVLAYFIFFRNHRGSSEGSPSTSGGGGTIDQSGATTTIQSGAVKVDVTQNPPDADTDKQPKPPVHHKRQRLDYRDLAIQALQDKGIQNPTPQQIADEQNDIRSTVGLGPAQGKPPPGGGTDVGVLPKRKPAPHKPAPRKRV